MAKPYLARNKVYNIINLNARDLLPCDWGSTDVAQAAVLDTTSANWPLLHTGIAKRSCGLLDQLAICLHENGIDIDPGDKYAFEPWIVSVDFSDAIRQRSSEEYEKDLRRRRIDALLERGFVLRRPSSAAKGPDRYLADGDKQDWHYVPFDKSANMARESRMCFVADRGYGGGGPVDVSGRLDERLRLGIDFSDRSVFGDSGTINWSKYYAYRGLYLTDSVRVEGLSGSLDQDTVLVLGSDKCPMVGVKRRVAVSTTIGPQEGTAVRSTTAWVSRFDGEGIVDPEFAKRMRDRLVRAHNDDARYRKANTFQVRMPFTKGVLHEVDFHRFLKDELELANDEDLYIEDAFGVWRQWSKVRMVVPTDMFKCYKWLKARAEKTNTADPMADYFDRFKRYDHALYVGNTNLTLRNEGTVALSAQMLSTLDLSNVAFDGLVEQRLREAAEALYDDDKGRAFLATHYDSVQLPEHDEGETAAQGTDDEPEGAEAVLADDDPEAPEGGQDLDGESTGDESGLRPETAWEYALKTNGGFARGRNSASTSIYFAATRDQTVASYLKGIAQHGRVPVSGGMRFLSHDLMAFLVMLAEKLRLHRDRSTPAVSKDAISEIAGRCLKVNQLYAPDARGLGGTRVKGTVTVAALRSPHLSRSEECVLQLANGVLSPLYKKYLGGLSGVAMVACESEVPLALGGADFDGDIVPLVGEDVIVRAVLDGAYLPDADPSSEDLPMRRIYPVAEPALETDGEAAREDTGIGRRITFDQLDATFNNNVGRISNAALRRAGTAYRDTTAPTEPFSGEDACAPFTIATGLEIDAVKQGVRPDLKDLLNSAKHDKGGWDYFYFKDDLARRLWVGGAKGFKRGGRGVRGVKDWHRAISRDARRLSGPQHKVTLKNTPANVDRLGLLLGKVLRDASKEEREPAKEPSPTPLFRWDLDDQGPGCPHISEEERRKVSALVDTYLLLRCDYWRLRWEQPMPGQEERFLRKAIRVVMASPGSGIPFVDAETATRRALGVLRDYFEQHDERSAKDVFDTLECDAIRRIRGRGLRQQDWALCPPGSREPYLQTLMPGLEVPPQGERTDYIDITRTDYPDGYMLLPYLLKQVIDDEASRGHLQREPDHMVQDPSFYSDCAALVNRCLDDRTLRVNWRREVQDMLRGRINMAIGNAERGGGAKLVRVLDEVCLKAEKVGIEREKLFWQLVRKSDLEACILAGDPAPKATNRPARR